MIGRKKKENDPGLGGCSLGLGHSKSPNEAKSQVVTLLSGEDVALIESLKRGSVLQDHFFGCLVVNLCQFCINGYVITMSTVSSPTY